MGNVFDEDCQSIRAIWNNSQYQALRRTVNNDNFQKYYSYCSECPCRFGMGDLAAHIGDDTWLEHIEVDTAKKAMLMAHRHRGNKK